MISQLLLDFPFHVSVIKVFCFELCDLDTTRQPRAGETDGLDYNFVNEECFKSLISKDSFLEYANFSGNWYGTSWSAINKIKEAGKICILDVDLAGVKSIKSHMKSRADLEARYIFVRPPCKERLEARLRSRGSETEESLNRRLARVDGDFEYADQPGNYDLNLVNDEFDSAYSELIEFIFEIKGSQESPEN